MTSKFGRHCQRCSYMLFSQCSRWPKLRERVCHRERIASIAEFERQVQSPTGPTPVQMTQATTPAPAAERAHLPAFQEFSVGRESACPGPIFSTRSGRFLAVRLHTNELQQAVRRIVASE